MTSAQLIGERYQLGDHLGSGGMGAVYKGTDTQTGDLVAIKVLHPGLDNLDPGMLTRFIREGEALRQLNHPNIVKMLAAFTEHDQHYLIMEYVPGGDLRKMLRQEGTLPVDRVLTLALELADALTRAHYLKIIHRDLKPANVLLAEDGTPRLTDFGVAHFETRERLTQTGAAIGTPDYLSPESLSGDPVDTRADVWSFGVLLFEMLAGQRPFHGDTMSQVVLSIVTEPFPDLETLRPDCPIALVDLVYRMCEKDRLARIRSMRQVGLELENIIQGVADLSEASTIIPAPHPTSRFDVQLIEPLTVREAEILALLAEGLSDREIGERLFLDAKTIKWYNQQIYDKLGLEKPNRNRKEAVAKARMLGLLDTSASVVIRPKHNLPAQTTPFVGRDHELVELAKLIDDPQIRLLTVLAPGGMGKTRLALAMGEQFLQSQYNVSVSNNLFPNGVWFIDLAPLSSLEGIVTTIADATGYQLSEDSRPPRQQILDYLSNKRLLLIMDNYEHLLDDATLVNDILQAAPDVKVLATSRERLNLTGEQLFTLSGMDFPDWETSDDALNYAAVKLFMQSAKRIRPNFELENEALTHLARICHLVAGMPLAIVLAATWIETLSLEEIVAEIAEDLNFLETDLRDFPARQRSIQAVFDSSWQRLSPQEQGVFAQTAVFRGGVTRQALQSMTSAKLRTLQALVNKGLLQRNPDSGRYYIHEVARQYAESKLKEMGKFEEAHDAHAAYFVDFMGDRLDDLKGKRQIEALDEIEADWENVRVSALWCWVWQPEEYALVMRSTHAMYLFCTMRSRFKEVQEMMSEVSETIADVESNLLRVALVIRFLTFDTRAEDQVKEALAVAREREDTAEIALSLWALGIIEYYGRKDYERALQYFEESAALYEQIGDSFFLARVLHEMSDCYNVLGQIEVAQEYEHRSLKLSRKTGNLYGEASALGGLGGIMVMTGQYDAAERYWQEALAIRRKLRFPVGVALFKEGLGLLALLRGDFQRTQVLAEEGLQVGNEYNVQSCRAFALSLLSIVASMRGDYVRGRELSQEGRRLPSDPMINSDAEWALAIASCGLGDFETAKKQSQVTLNFGFQTRHSSMNWNLPIVALVLADEGKSEKSVKMLALAFTHPKSPIGWMEEWPLLAQLQVDLKAELGEDTYTAAWERGKTLDLETVVQELLTENS